MKNFQNEPADDVRRRIESLERRVSALEEAKPRDERAGEEEAATAAGKLWAVDVLRRRRGSQFEREDARGSLLYAGSLFARGVGTIAWQIERPVPGVLDYDWSGAAHLLAALAHPVRVEVLRRLLAGARTSQDLQEIDQSGTSGRLYHHLRDLLASGLIVSPRRNHYEIPPQKVVPSLIIIAAAAELSMGNVGVPHRDVEASERIGDSEIDAG